MSEEDEPKDVFKGSEKLPASYALVNKELTTHKDRLKAIAEKLDDPVFLSAMMYQIVHEKENNNRILKNIYVELERLKAGEKAGFGKGKEPEDEFLSEVDEKIISFIREHGKACAEDLQEHLGYRGKNGASARLNRLYLTGLLGKKQAGRTVYYVAKN